MSLGRRSWLNSDVIQVRILRDWIAIAKKILDNNWVIDEDIRLVVRNYVIFKELESDMIENNSSYRGNYLLVNSLTERFHYESYDRCRVPWISRSNWNRGLR